MSTKQDNESSSIVLVDDDADILEVIKLDLQDHSFDVYGFTDPKLALEHFSINPKRYSLVISDIRMPSMNGFEFVKKVKQIKPEGIKNFLVCVIRKLAIPNIHKPLH